MTTNADILFFDKDCPLDAVVSLAEPRDVPGLNEAFLSILKEHIPHRAVKVYEIINEFRRHADRHTQTQQNLKLILETQESHSPLQLEYHEADVQECISTKSPVTNQQRSIFPIPGLTTPLGLLVIEGPVDESVKNFLDPLLRIYSSHAFILNRNEHDSLTGLYNRHTMENKLNQIYQCQVHGKRANDDKSQPWCIALLDIDFFKQINDQYGHLYGDEVLIMFSRLMQSSFREDDLLFRFGGEEFLVALKNVDRDKAEVTLNRFRRQVEETRFDQIKQVTVSIGFAELDTSQALSSIIERADRALYYSKYQGRNRVSSYENLLALGLVESCEINSNNVEIFPHQQKKIS